MRNTGNLRMRIAGHVGLLALVLMSIALATERVIYMDSAVQLFEMIQRGSFTIYDHRLPMVVTQTLPLLAIKLGMSLHTVVVAYAMSAPLLAYTAFLIIVYLLKDTHAGLLLLLPLLCMRHTFFHGISETFSLMVYAALLAALLRHSPKHHRSAILHICGTVLCTAACVFIHPVGMFFVVYLIGYHITIRGMHPRVPLMAGAATLAIAATANLLIPSGHNADYAITLSSIRHGITHIGQLEITQSFFSHLPSLYIYPVALYCLSAIWHIRQRQWWRLAYCVAFNICFVLMTVIVYQREGSAIGIERSWLPIVFFSGVPVACEILPKLRRPAQCAAAVLCTAATLASLCMTAGLASHYRQRIEQMEKIAEAGRAIGQRKLVADAETSDKIFEINSWATAFETMIVSSLHGPQHTVTLFVEENSIDADNPDYQETHAFLGAPWWRLWYYDVLRPEYFSLPEQPYQRLTFNGVTPVIGSLHPSSEEDSAPNPPMRPTP